MPRSTRTVEIVTTDHPVGISFHAPAPGEPVNGGTVVFASQKVHTEAGVETGRDKPRRGSMSFGMLRGMTLTIQHGGGPVNISGTELLKAVQELYERYVALRDA